MSIKGYTVQLCCFWLNGAIFSSFFYRIYSPFCYQHIIFFEWKILWCVLTIIHNCNPKKYFFPKCSCISKIKYPLEISLRKLSCLRKFSLTLCRGLLFGLNEAQAKNCVSRSCRSVLLHAGKSNTGKYTTCVGHVIGEWNCLK